MSGAQVVPIFAFSDTTYLDNILSKVNGVLFTGGGMEFNINNKWTKNADHILKYAIDQNKKGNPYPVWGTCLGFELLAYLTCGYDSKVLSPVRGESGVRNTIKIQGHSYLYDDLSTELRYNLENGQGSTFFNHVWAVSTKYFQASEQLKAFWRVTSTSTSTFSEEFVSTLESIDYPIYAVQYHPEKNLFEWKVNAVRSASGTLIAQILSNKFIDVARNNKNRFSSDDEFSKAVIYNYQTHFTTMSFTQIYLFNETVSNQIEEEQVNLTTQ